MKNIILNYKSVMLVILWNFTGQPVNIHLKPWAMPYHGKSYRIPYAFIYTVNKELSILEKLGVIKRYETESKCTAPWFIITKKNGTVRFVSDFRESNKNIERDTWNMPNIQYSLDSILGFQFTTVIDLNIGLYAIRLDWFS